MKNYLITVIILFCSYLFIYTTIDLVFYSKINWNMNLILSTFFSLLISRLLTNNKT